MKRIIGLGTICLIYFFVPLKAAEAYCNWTSRQIIEIPGQMTQTVSCLANETKSDSSKCGGTPPANSDCCCGQGAARKTVQEIAQESQSKKPMFNIPDLNVRIPGMASLTAANCTGEGNNTKCQVNWIGEYVKGFYNYAVGIAGILAVIVLMIAGVIWLVSGGDASRITQAKELIAGGLGGLVLLLCSYVLLYQINPNLVGFNPLTLGYIPEIPAIENGSDSETNATANNVCPDPDSLKSISGLVATNAQDPHLTASALEGLKAAITEASRQGVKLYVTSANRTYAVQQKLWEGALAKYSDPAVARKYVAQPSPNKCSGHMAGSAIDVCINGTNSCSHLGSQNKANATYSDADVTKLQAIMRAAGWIRYCGEWWHYQYNNNPGLACP